jgi:acetyl esterase
MLRDIGVTAARGRPPATPGVLAPEVARRTEAFEVLTRGRERGARFSVTTPTDRSPRGVLLWVHGGGWVLGDSGESPEFRRVLADRTGMLVASVDYPLAPEHRFPAALEEVERALRHLARRRPDGCPLLVGGDSAGGNLATVALRRCAGERPSADGQVLVYPLTDHRLDRDSHRRHGGRDAVLPLADLRWFRELYLAEGVRADDPDVAPLRSPDLGVLPPTILVLADEDPVKDEGRAYGEALRGAGVAVECHVFEREEHGFVTQVGVRSAAEEALALIGRFASRRPHQRARPDLAEILFPPPAYLRCP